MSASRTVFFKLCWVFKWSWFRAKRCPWTLQLDILTIWDLITYETGGRKRYGSLLIMQNNSTVRPTPTVTLQAGLHVQDKDLLKGLQGARHTLTYAIWAHKRNWVGRTQRLTLSGTQSTHCPAFYRPPREPLCLATCCRCRMCRHSFRQFIVAMDVALSMSRSWSKGERPGAAGRPSMLWIKSLCWPWAWVIIWREDEKDGFIFRSKNKCNLVATSLGTVINFLCAGAVAIIRAFNLAYSCRGGRSQHPLVDNLHHVTRNKPFNILHFQLCVW